MHAQASGPSPPTLDSVLGLVFRSSSCARLFSIDASLLFWVLATSCSGIARGGFYYLHGAFSVDG